MNTETRQLTSLSFTGLLKLQIILALTSQLVDWSIYRKTCIVIVQQDTLLA